MKSRLLIVVLFITGSINLFAQGNMDLSKVRLRYSVRLARDASKTAMDSLSSVFKIRKNGEVKLILSKGDKDRYYYQEVMRTENTRPDTMKIFYVDKKSKQIMSCQGAEIVKPYMSSTSELRTVYRLDSLILKPKTGLFRIKLENKDSMVYNRVYYVIDSLTCYLHYQDKNLVSHTINLNKRDSIHFPAPIYRLNKLVLINTLDSSEVICKHYYIANYSNHDLFRIKGTNVSEFNRRNLQIVAAEKNRSARIWFDLPPAFEKFIPTITFRNWPFEEVTEETE
ncbi:MAG: hypothetical protein VZQ98_04265 [Bacteroidales bacterium]|nr:hypothetical protein [Bacteroidales bacterium]